MKEVHENKKAVIQFKDVVRTYGEGEAPVHLYVSGSHRLAVS